MEDVTEATTETPVEKSALEQFAELGSVSHRSVSINLLEEDGKLIMTTDKDGNTLTGELTLTDGIWTWAAKPNLQIVNQPLAGAVLLFADRV